MLMSRSMARISIKGPHHSQHQDFLKQEKPSASCNLFFLTIRTNNWLHDLERERNPSTFGMYYSF